MKITTLYILVAMIACFVLGLFLGQNLGQKVLFEGMATALSGSNVNLTIDVNETELVNQVNKTIVPEFRKIILEGVKDER